jgi:protein SCO1/2
MTRRLAPLALLLAAWTGAQPLVALAHTGDEPGFDRQAALATSQGAVGDVLDGSHGFTTADGRYLRLADLRGRPLVVSLVYTSCEHVCPLLTEHLARVVAIARDALGEDSFRVITVGFDTRNDTPRRMQLYARAHGAELPGWYFLSTDPPTMAALAGELGFVFHPAPQGFNHLTQTTVVDASGRVYRQVYGTNYEPPVLVEPLKELVFGRPARAATVSGWIDSVRLFCTIYDPASGRYRFDYSIFIGAGIGLISLGSIAAFVIKAWRGSRPSRTSA